MTSYDGTRCDILCYVAQYYDRLCHSVLCSPLHNSPVLTFPVLTYFLSFLFLRFMREERLREGLERARKQRVDLEGALLERDSQAMEIR